MNICVYGAASPIIDKKYTEVGEKLGRLLGERGHTLVFGGGNSGLMGAVVRGITEQGGESIGISPEFFRPDGVLFEGSSKTYFTADMRSRKAMLDSLSNGFIISPGGTGTYDEFFEIFTLKRLGQTNKPIAILNTDGYYDPLLKLLYHTAELGFMEKEDIESMLFVSDDIEKIVDYIEKNAV